MKIVLLAFVVMNQSAGCAAHHPGPELLDNGVRFTLSAPKARSVALAGSFNQWDPHQDMLRGPDDRGVWSITLPIPAGRYEYLFIIDDKTWLPDPYAPSAGDGMGGENSVLFVEESALTHRVPGRDE